MTFNTAPSKPGAQPYTLQNDRMQTKGAGRTSSGGYYGDDPNTVRFEYDPVGNVTAVIEPHRITRYRYSPDRELIGTEVEER